jgi:pyruvate/2-oxoglutarate dehydrogenase complex dihydrolipoamide acyltransferase (E2) component
MHHYDRLDYADRWLTDGFRVLQENPVGFIGTLDIEMTRAKALVAQMRARGVAGSYAGIMVRAVALAMARNSESHALLVGSRRMRPDNVSIGLSVSGETATAAAPVMRLEQVDTKTLVAVCEEVAVRAPEVRAEDSRTLAKLRKWGWMIPTGWLRRFVLRRVMSSLRFRRLFGSLQVTIVSGVDIVAALAYGAPGIVGLGRIEERVVVRDGKPAVRHMATMSFAGDHKLWNGERIVRFMAEVRKILESDELLAEVPAPDVASAAPHDHGANGVAVAAAR